MRVLLLDNEDSFTYNLAHALEACDQVNLEIWGEGTTFMDRASQYDRIVLSPGPGLPQEHPWLIPFIQRYSGQIPILGVCLGLQAIYMAFGGTLSNLPQVCHGVSSRVTILDPQDALFHGIPNPFPAGRYHSWIANPQKLPEALKVTATDPTGSIMALRHRIHPTYALQFHPESILTPDGKTMIRNFVDLESYQPNK